MSAFQNHIRSFMWISGFEELRIRGIRGAEEFFTSLHYFITKKSSTAKVQGSKFKNIPNLKKLVVL